MESLVSNLDLIQEYLTWIFVGVSLLVGVHLYLAFTQRR